MSKQIPWNKGKKCPQISKALKGRVTPEYIKEKIRQSTTETYKSEELRNLHRQNTISYLKNGGMKNKDTKIELLFKKALYDRNVKFEEQKRFKLGIADFYLPDYDTFVFCDGDYWHNYPHGKPRDHKQVESLEQEGHRVYRFWEHDINKNPEICLKQIMM